MHDVFRYWLPGHFWEGLYVKWVKLCLLGTPRLPKKKFGVWGPTPSMGPRGPKYPKMGPLGPIEGVGPQIPNFF